MTEVLLIRCIGCGAPLGNQVPGEGALEHVRRCEGHPLGSELRHLRDQRDDLQARNTALVEERRAPAARPQPPPPTPDPERAAFEAKVDDLLRACSVPPGALVPCEVASRARLMDAWDALARRAEEWERHARALGMNGVCGECGGPRWFSVERVAAAESRALAAERERDKALREVYAQESRIIEEGERRAAAESALAERTRRVEALAAALKEIAAKVDDTLAGRDSERRLRAFARFARMVARAALSSSSEAAVACSMCQRGDPCPHAVPAATPDPTTPTKEE